MEKPSKYHKRVYTGRNKENGGYEWSWDSTHPGLEPTDTFIINNTHYCSYCCKLAFPIQAGLRKELYTTSFFKEIEDYTVTGYCCICKSAEAEKRYSKTLKEMQERHTDEENILRKAYSKLLKKDKRTKLKMEYETELKDLERQEKYNQ